MKWPPVGNEVKSTQFICLSVRLFVCSSVYLVPSRLASCYIIICLCAGVFMFICFVDECWLSVLVVRYTNNKQHTTQDEMLHNTIVRDYLLGHTNGGMSVCFHVMS